MGTTHTDSTGDHHDGRQVRMILEARPERKLIPRAPSFRHIDFHLQVAQQPQQQRERRSPLTLALVLDRSGSMSGDKIETAKRATLAVVNQLDERDTAAVVVFDEHIDTVQPAAPVTQAVKDHVRAQLAKIGARGSTAMHEGWLTGCKAIAPEGEAPSDARGVVRCFLLTDGQANVGVTDAEHIASDAAGIRSHAGIGTSTFGVGLDYAEELLGPMAEAGGGRFHHLRTADEIATTFIGELGELLATAAANVHLELEVEPGVIVEVVSTYWASPSADDPTRWSITTGDLLSGEDRHVVVRFGFTDQPHREEQAIRARVLWNSDGGDQSTDWHELRFTYAEADMCDAEPQDAAVMHWAGQHLADRAQREALRYSKSGDVARARSSLTSARAYIASMHSLAEDAALQQEVDELDALALEMLESPLPSMRAKELYFAKQAKTKGYRDLRLRQAGEAMVSTEQLAPDKQDKLLAGYLRSSVLWPAALPQALSEDILRDRFRGCLFWGAVGDALGRPLAGLSPREIRARFGAGGLTRYVPSLDWRSGPTGTITEDTQLTMEVARSLIATNGHFTPNDFARKLVALQPRGRGLGKTMTQSLAALAGGVPWWEAGQRVHGGGNGAALRAAPVGLVHALDAQPLDLRRDAILSALPTHAEPIGVAGAVAMAAAVGWLLRSALSGATELDRQALLDFVCAAIAGMESKPSQERRPGGGRVRLAERLRELPALLALPTPEEAFARTWNGSYTLESVPAAFYSFLRTPDDPQQALRTAVNAGYAADSVGSMAGQLAGAWCGAERLWRDARAWWDELESRAELSDLADQLATLALTTTTA